MRHEIRVVQHERVRQQAEPEPTQAHKVQELSIVFRPKLRMVRHVMEAVVFGLRAAQAAEVVRDEVHDLCHPPARRKDCLVCGPLVYRKHPQLIQQPGMQGAADHRRRHEPGRRDNQIRQPKQHEVLGEEDAAQGRQINQDVKPRMLPVPAEQLASPVLDPLQLFWRQRLEWTLAPECEARTMRPPTGPRTGHKKKAKRALGPP